VSIFRNIPLLVQFFIWYFVVPELLPAIGTWIKQLPPGTQFFTASMSVSGCSPAHGSASRCARASTRCRGQKNAGLAMGFTLADLPLRAAADGFPLIVPPLTSEFLNIFKNSAVARRSACSNWPRRAPAGRLHRAALRVVHRGDAAYVLINLVVMALMRWIEGRTPLPGYIGGK
jgi:glutamate/aspartate transport system permease protein